MADGALAFGQRQIPSRSASVSGLVIRKADQIGWAAQKAAARQQRTGHHVRQPSRPLEAIGVIMESPAARYQN
jgi:hypothetical protein